MLTNKKQAQTYVAIERKGNIYHVNFYLRVASRFANFFTSENPAPARVATQLACFNAALTAEDDFFKVITKSNLTPLIEEWDRKRDNNTSSLRAMSQAYAINNADTQKQADGQSILDLMKHYKLNINDNYENQGSKTLQFTQAVDSSAQVTAAIANIGATAFYQGIKEANEQCRALIDQRNLERSELPQQSMVNLRAKTEAEYRDLIFITNAYAMTTEDIHEWDPLLNVLNEDIYYYEKTIFAGSGGSSSSGGSDIPDEPDTPDTPDDPDTPDTPTTPHITITKTGSGTVNVRAGATAIESGAEVEPGTALIIEVNPESGSTPTATFNGDAVSLHFNDEFFVASVTMPDTDAELLVNTAG